MTRETQKMKVLAYMKEHGSITPLEALDEFGCYRLGARIWDLRHAGYSIKTTNERYLDMTDLSWKTYARYALVE